MKLVLHLLCFNKTFSRLVGLSVDEIAALLEEDRLGQGAKDVVLFPPGDDDNTDVDSEDKETSNPKNINHFEAGLLAQQSLVDFANEDLPDHRGNFLVLSFTVNGHFHRIVYLGSKNMYMYL
jgi:hypothetical protein